MNKLLPLTILSVLLAGCTTPKTPSQAENTVHYVCPMDTAFTVVYSKDGETATLFDAADRVFVLTHSEAASGALYKNKQGVFIHEKGGNLLVSLMPNRTIECTEFKEKNNM